MGRTGRVILLILLLLTAAYFSFIREPDSTRTPPPEKSESPPPESDPAPPPGAGDPAAETEEDLTDEELARIAAELAGFWLLCLGQQDDRNLRTETIEAVKQALGSADPLEVQAALQVAPLLVPLGVDAAALRALVMPHLGSEDATMRAVAALAFHKLSGEGVDREPLLAMTRDSSESVRISLAEVISDHPGPLLTDREGDALLEILATDDRKFLLTAVGGLTPKNLPPRLEARILTGVEAKSPTVGEKRREWARIAIEKIQQR